MRAMHRLRAACEARGECKPALGADPLYYNYSRQLQKNLEHTWGVSVGHYGALQNSNWTNQEFAADLAANNSNLDYMVASWEEQRNYGVHYPIGNGATLQISRRYYIHPQVNVLTKHV